MAWYNFFQNSVDKAVAEKFKQVNFQLTNAAKAGMILDMNPHFSYQPSDGDTVGQVVLNFNYTNYNDENLASEQSGIPFDTLAEQLQPFLNTGAATPLNWREGVDGDDIGFGVYVWVLQSRILITNTSKFTIFVDLYGQNRCYLIKPKGQIDEPFDSAAGAWVHLPNGAVAVCHYDKFYYRK